jgi:hypothetical protein
MKSVQFKMGTLDKSPLGVISSLYSPFSSAGDDIRANRTPSSSSSWAAEVAVMGTTEVADMLLEVKSAVSSSTLKDVSAEDGGIIVGTSVKHRCKSGDGHLKIPHAFEGNKGVNAPEAA